MASYGGRGASNNQSCWKVKSTKYLAKVAGLCDKCSTNTSRAAVARGRWQLAGGKHVVGNEETKEITMESIGMAELTIV